MSDPFTMFLIQAGTAAASGAVSLASAAGNASAQSDANEIAKQNSIEARDANYDQLHLMAQQSQASAEQQIFENDTEALQATERAKVSAGESGVTGLSVDALLADMYGRQARFNDNVTQNLENQQQQIGFEMENAARTSQSQINSLPTPQKPDYLGTALGTGSGIFGAYKTHLKVK